jgi:HK97 family phage major capsid protein
MEFLDKLRAQLRARLDERAAKADELEALLAVPAAEERSELTELETSQFAEIRGVITEIDEETTELRARITEMESFVTADQEARAEAAHVGETVDATETRVSIKSAEMTYRQGGEHSYFKDLALASAPGRFDGEARARLVRHAEEVAVETRTNMSRTDGQGGEFVPPLWLLNQYISLARAGRVSADLASKYELPAGTDSINLPKISTGSVVAAQTDNSAATNVDMTTATVTAPVNTYAGQQLFALSLLEQSPINFDQVVFADLIAAHAQAIGSAVIGGSGSSGAHTGILTNTGTNSITYTATTPTGAGVYAAIAQGISNVAKNRFLPADAVVMNPSRWYWLVAQVDSNGRPLVVPTAQAWNAVGDIADTRAEGMVGTIAGVPVYLDPNIGSTYSTNQDRVIVARFSDLALFEGPLRSRVLFETNANTLQVRLQVYSYSAFTSYRRSNAISVLSGTGMAAPSGY